MIFFTLIIEALDALWANRLRSALTVLGMVMGVTSVITIVSTVEGLQSDIEESLAGLGPKTFIVSRFGFNMSWTQYLERLKRKKLTVELIPLIEAACPDCDEVAAEAYKSDHIKYGSQRMRWVSIEGHTPNVLDTRDVDMIYGRYISWQDQERRRNVTVIGFKVYEKFFEGIDPVGERIKIGSHEFTVIGVTEKSDGMMVRGFDEVAVIPISTHQKIYQQPGNPVSLTISAVSLDRREAAIDQVTVVLRASRRVPYGDDDDFAIFTPEAILSFVNDITQAFRVIIISLPLVSIIVGGIVIMNIMMISVTERTREIGIRKSIGAASKHILTQFIYESVALSLIGGALGVGCGVWLSGYILHDLMDISMNPTGLGIILGFGISTGVGLFFGIYPALKASRLDPVMALSYE